MSLSLNKATGLLSTILSLRGEDKDGNLGYPQNPVLILSTSVTIRFLFPGYLSPVARLFYIMAILKGKALSGHLIMVFMLHHSTGKTILTITHFGRSSRAVKRIFAGI